MALGPHIRCRGHHGRHRKHPSGQTGIVIAIATVTEIVTATAADEVDLGGLLSIMGFG